MKRTHKAGDRPTPSLRLATWNLNNFGLRRKEIRAQASGFGWAIAHHLENPHIIALQEMCDDSGLDDDGTTSAQKNAQLLIDAIQSAGGKTYAYCEAAPENNSTGGRNGANIRCGFLYRPDRVALAKVPHSSDPAIASISTFENRTALKHNPCLIHPTDAAFFKSRKPLVAHFIDTATQEDYFITNVHLSLNQRIETHSPSEAAASQAKIAQQRVDQVTLVSDFVQHLNYAIADKGHQKTAHIVVCGDLNTQAHQTNNEAGTSTPREIHRLHHAGLRHMADRMNTHKEALLSGYDHIYVSSALMKRICPENSGAKSFNHMESLSDHHPLMASIRPAQQAKDATNKAR